MREFCVSTGSATVLATSGTLVYLRATTAPSMNIEVLRWWCSQNANATSAQQRIQIVYRGTNFPTLTVATPVSLKMQDPNTSVLISSTVGSTAGIAGVISTAENAFASATSLISDAFNVLNGWLHVPTPPETIINPAGHGTGIALFFPVGPATNTGWNVGCHFREV